MSDTDFSPTVFEVLTDDPNPADNPSETTSHTDYSPTVCLTDSDHAIENDSLSNILDNGRDPTGTPMFISFELGAYDAWLYSTLGMPDWIFLQKRLKLVDGHAEVLRRAFPSDNGQFMSAFQRVFDSEASRQVYARLSARPVHQPRHDAESIYWFLLWALARARPRGSKRETGRCITHYTDFAARLLKHRVGESEKTRAYSITSPTDLLRLLHPALEEFEEELLRPMAAYLSIPWHLYPDACHVHVAFRRLILGCLLSQKEEVVAALRVPLDTLAPRRLDAQYLYFHDI